MSFQQRLVESELEHRRRRESLELCLQRRAVQVEPVFRSDRIADSGCTADLGCIVDCTADSDRRAAVLELGWDTVAGIVGDTVECIACLDRKAAVLERDWRSMSSELEQLRLEPVRLPVACC